MVIIKSSAQVFTGYQGPFVAAAAQKPAQTAETGNVSDTDRAAGDDAGEISRKMQSLQKSHDKNERRMEQRYARESQKLESEYQQQKTDLEAELRHKKQRLKVNIYV